MDLGYRLAALCGAARRAHCCSGLWMLHGRMAATACLWMNRTLEPHADAVGVSRVLLANATFFLVLVNFVTVPFERLQPAAHIALGRETGSTRCCSTP